MKLDEKHKEFAVKCYAQFMTRTEVTNAFIQEFAHDLPPPPPEPPEPPDSEQQNSSIDDELEKEEYIAKYLEEFEERYQNTYEYEAEKKFEQDTPKLREQLENDYVNACQEEHDKERTQQHLAVYQKEVQNHKEEVKRNLSDRLRRLNITHRQFPEKYRDLFNQTRKEYFVSYRTENLQNPDNIILELETLYGYVKQRVFQEVNPKEAIKHVNLAHNILKTIATCNAINAKQEIVDITPQKELTDT